MSTTDAGKPIETSVVFQPIVDLTDGTVLGYEALGRLRGRETEGFLPLQQEAKAHGGVAKMFLQLQSQALRTAAERPLDTLLFLNVQISTLAALRRQMDHGTRSQLVLEIPESDRRLDAWRVRLQEFRAEGVGIAIDDWGVGAADPLRLIHLRPEWLKIDVALVRQVGKDEAVDRLLDLLVRWVNPDATHLIAEGIEDLDQIMRLRRLGIRYGQGFALARPGPTWVQRVEVPRRSARLSHLRRQSLAVIEGVSLTDEDLAELEQHHSVLAPLLSRAIEEVSAWLGTTAAVVQATQIGSQDYRMMLEQHFAALTRGYLDGSDYDRAQRFAEYQQRQGIDLAYYVLGYRRLQASMAKMLRMQEKSTLASILREVFSWDMAVTMHAYQKLLDRDSLTGVLTRRAFWYAVERQIPEALKRNQVWIFVLIDLDGFKAINDQLGHIAGDQVLIQIGEEFQELMTAQYLVGRLGGDEFGIWMPHRDGDTVHQEISKLKRILTLGIAHLSLTAGTAVLGRDGTTADALYARADRNLYQARRRQLRRPMVHG